MHVILLLWWAAQPAPPAAAQPDDAQLAEAKQHYERGKELFKSGAYDQAILEFKAADQIKPSPILAYNIGLAYEKLNRCKAAAGFFQRYLREQPDAENRADTEQKIADQQAKLARGECAGQQRLGMGPAPGPGPDPGPGPGPGPGLVQPPPGPGPDVTPAPPVRTDNGMHPTAIGLRLGPVFGGLGAVVTKPIPNATDPTMPIPAFENTTGFHLRAAVQFPLILFSDGQTIVQGEVFGDLAAYGSSGNVIVKATGARIDTTAKLAGAGFAMRGNIYPSRKIPLAITPALGLGVAGQLYNLSTSDGACAISSGIPSVLINIDLAARFELAVHHALYLAPSIYILPAGLTDGGDVDFSCIGGASVTAEKAFGTDSTQTNVAIDFGYMFQF